MNDEELKQLVNSKQVPRVGDRVRLLKDGKCDRLYGFDIGGIYTVQERNRNMGDQECRIHNERGYNGYCMFDQLEVVT